METLDLSVNGVCEEPNTHLLDLPSGLWAVLCGFLDTRSKVSLRETCQATRQHANCSVSTVQVSEGWNAGGVPASLACRFPFTKRLDFSSVAHELTNESLAFFSNTCIANLPHLVSVELVFCKTPAVSGLQALAAACPQLHSLSLLSLAIDASPANQEQCLQLMAVVKTLTNLTELHAWQLPLPERALVHLSHMTRLQRVTLFDQTVSGEGLAALSSLTNVKQLDLAESQVSDQALQALSTLVNLQELNLESTGITAEGLSTITHFTGLRTLIVSITISNIAWSALSACCQLKYLGVCNFNITAARLGHLTSLQVCAQGCEFRHLHKQDHFTSRCTYNKPITAMHPNVFGICTWSLSPCH